MNDDILFVDEVKDDLNDIPLSKEINKSEPDIFKTESVIGDPTKPMILQEINDIVINI